MQIIKKVRKLSIILLKSFLNKKKVKQSSITTKKIKDLSSKVRVDKDVATIAAVVTDQDLVIHASKSYVGQLLEDVGFKAGISKENENDLPEYMGADYHKLPISKVADVNPERLIVMVDEDNQKISTTLKSLMHGIN